ncbi:MAG: cyclic nucleotide-binding domain-containing protein [Anaerolineaceae bacterium]|nr:cyclic nucleotide-binding domain-containing protein [Anaerolineaceae bacterium]
MNYSEIPEEELEKYMPYMRVYSQNMDIVREGEKDDKGLFMLRSGRVSVYKETDEKRIRLGFIDAINFFGEMALFTGGARTATVEAASEKVIVYAFRRPDLRVLMSNPKWGTMLATRLTYDLKIGNEKNLQMASEKRVLQNRYDKLYANCVQAFSLITEIQHTVAYEAVVNSKEFRNLLALSEMTRKILINKLPNVTNNMSQVDEDTLGELNEKNIISDDLLKLIGQSRLKAQLKKEAETEDITK